MFIILALLAMPSIMTTTSPRNMANSLIRAKNKVSVEQTFKTLEKEQREEDLSEALCLVVVEKHNTIAADCLKLAHDPYPNSKSSVGFLVDKTLGRVFSGTNHAEHFANVITSFNLSDVKPIASLRFRILQRFNARSVLENVMAKSPELIMSDLPNWLASHRFDQMSFSSNGTSREEAFQYLISFATVSILKEALSIVKENDHYKVGFGGKAPMIMCCPPLKLFPQDLFNKLKALLELMEARNALIGEELLPLLPAVLVELVLDYIPRGTD